MKHQLLVNAAQYSLRIVENYKPVSGFPLSRSEFYFAAKSGRESASFSLYLRDQTSKRSLLLENFDPRCTCLNWLIKHMFDSMSGK
jgi:hypothetical protein